MGPAGRRRGRGRARGISGAGVPSTTRVRRVPRPNRLKDRRPLVPPEVPIVTFEPGQRDALTAGAHVVLFVRADAQGALTAQRVLVGKDGMVPPM